MKILLSGMLGFMGQEICRLCSSEDDVSVCGVDIKALPEDTICVADFENAATDVDCIIDFSHHSLTEKLIDFAKAHKIPVVVATTGQTEQEKDVIYEASKAIPVFFCANMSVGIALMEELVKKTLSLFPEADVEIVEVHHNRKLDAPSGTAKMLANAVKEVRPSAYEVYGRGGQSKRTKEEIGMHSLRMGNIVGEHEVIIATENQTITLKHEAHSRALFAEGALLAAKYIVKKNSGLYTVKDMISGK